jgi:hypothetical protein
MTHFLFVVPTDEQLTEAKIYDLFHLLTPALDLLCSFYKRSSGNVPGLDELYRQGAL